MLNRKFGKKPPRRDRRTLKLENYIEPNIAPPASADWLSGVNTWPMMGNDVVGDCTYAGAGHLIESWSAYESGKTIIVSDEEILKAYKATSGWNGILNDRTDTGCNLLDVLNYWHNVGVGDHKITAYTRVKPRNVKCVKLGIWMFGGLYTGVALPDVVNGVNITEASSWIGSPTQDPKTLPNPDNGHCVPIVYYDDKVLKVISWGMVMEMSWPFFMAYCDEAYAILAPDWTITDGKSPSGFLSEALMADLKIVTG
ncbi:MAG: hypothetical protein M0R50_09910 [Candidatus Cloacimonetes bacterium]|jgi:hypothetical protein|nr:hypothetical protein [Candidatus Cloacimonadota bacterium]